MSRESRTLPSIEKLLEKSQEVRDLAAAMMENGYAQSGAGLREFALDVEAYLTRSENAPPLVDIGAVRRQAFEEAAASIAIGADSVEGVGRISSLVRDILHDVAKQVKALGESPPSER